MIRPITCVGFILACASGFYLYQTKHRVTVIDRETASVVRQTSVIRKQIPILAAEWALLNQPDRIQQLADQYLALKPTDPSQFATLEVLDCRLPQILSAEGTPVACAAPSAEPPPVPSADLVAQAEPASIATAQVSPVPGNPRSLRPETNPVPPVQAIVTTTSPASSPPTRMIESQSAPEHREATRPEIDIAQVQRQHEAEVGANQVTETETARVPAPAGPAAQPSAEVGAVPAASSLPVSSPPAAMVATQPSSPAPVAPPVSVDVAQIQPQRELEVGKSQLLQDAVAKAPSPAGTSAPPEASPVSPPSPISAAIQPVASSPPGATPANAEADRLAAELAQLKQQRQAEAARNRLLQEEADRLAAQIVQRQKSLEGLRAPAVAAKQPLPVPAIPIPPPALAAGTQAASAAAARVAAELAHLKQQHDAEAATNRRLQEEVDRLAMRMGQQQKFVDAPRAKLASAKPLPAPAAPVGSSSFTSVESIVTRLRHETPPHEPPPQEVQPPAPVPSPPTMTAQYRPQVRPSSPWLALMNARAALRAGDPYESRQRLEEAQSALLSQPSRRHYFASEQISMAVALINAGANIPALHFMDLAIANAGSGVPYAAESMPPQAAYPPWGYQP